jgi:nitroreductase
MPKAEDAVEFLRSLRAIRAFRPDPIPPLVVDALLDAARWTGSAHNRQPWEVVVVRDRERLRALADAGVWARHLAQAPLGIALVMFGEDPIVEAFDEGRLSERLMLAARAHGVGSCIAWFDEPVGADEVAKTILAVPAERTFRTVLAFGYPLEAEAEARAELKPAAARKPIADFVFAEQYGRRSGLD